MIKSEEKLGLNFLAIFSQQMAQKWAKKGFWSFTKFFLYPNEFIIPKHI